MSAQTSEFNIKIRTDADTSGAQSASSALDNITEQTGKATDAAEKHGHSEREVREELRLMGEQAGPLGQMLRFAFSGPLIALSAFGAAVEAVKGEFAKLAAVVDQFNEAERAISDAKIKAVADATHAAALAAVDAADAEAKLNAAYADGDTAMTNRLKLFDEEIAALIKVEDAKEKAFEAELDRMVKLGKITKEQADAAKENAQLEMDKFKGSTDQAKLQNEIAERQKQLAEAQKNLQTGADQQAIDAARAGETPSKSLIAQYDAAIKGQETYLANLEKLKTAAEGANATAKTATEIAEEKAKHDQEIVRTAPAQIDTLQQQAQIQSAANTQAESANAQAAWDRTAPSDDGIQSGAARERGPQAQVDSQKTAANARELEARLRNQNHASPDDFQQVHEALERILGLLGNPDVTTSRKIDLDDILYRLKRLEAMRDHGVGNQ